jgi:class 3 adenylate cyclase/predicted ATPase
MMFEEVVDQAIAMLQRRGRVTYRLLKRQFTLDDEALEDLKIELIKGQRLAVDEAGEVLVWTGAAGTAPASPAPLFLHPPHPHPPPPDAERRQLTVLFCDLVDSTVLASQLDPEDLREVVRAYQEVCAKVVARFEGHIAQYLGDGLLVYFGYPLAHEDDAQRAVRAGLGMIEALGQLNARVAQERGVHLAVRLGIHTGLVVVGEVGGGTRQEQLALGETPNVAARLQGLAAPDTVVISADTSRLVEGYFECCSLGAQVLRGVAEPITVYHVLQASGAQSRLDVASTRGFTPLVGREAEVTLLLERWQLAKGGQGHVVLLTGEGGIGKSRLVQVLKDHVANEAHTRWECRSLPYYHNTALYPLIDFFQRALHWHQDDSPEERLDTLEQELRQYRLPLTETMPLFAPLLSLSVPEDRYPPLALSPQRLRQKTLESIVAMLLERAEREPVLFILEDLHWTDPTTLEFLGLLVEQVPTAALAMLLTCRPEFQPAWSHRAYLTEITVNRLSRQQIARVAEHVAGGKTLPPEVLQPIVEKTDGVPLFVEEMTKAILESGDLKDVDGHYELVGSLSTLTIPATLQDSLMARLDRLVTAKAVAQYAAVIGRQFAYDVLSMVSQLDPATLQRELGRLVEAEIVYQRGVPPQSIYVFKHALIQDAAYTSLLKSTRQQYHQRIAQVLEAQFPEAAEAQPELLAHHYTEAGLREQAIPYWQRAGQRALNRSATLEAVAHLTKGLEVLSILPDTPERAQQELALHTTLGPALMALKGFEAPEVLHAYARAHELCQQVGDTRQLFAALWGLWYLHQVRGELQRACEVGEELLGVARQLQAPEWLMVAHRVLGNSLFWWGELGLAHTHVQHALALHDPQQMRDHAVRYGTDTGIACRLLGAVTLWLLGYPDQARQWSVEALTHAQELRHAFTLQQALCFSALLHLLRREAAVAQELAETQQALCTEHGFAPYLAWGTIFRGSAVAAQGAWAEGLAQLREGLAAYRTRGRLPWLLFLSLLADACGRAGQVEEGLCALDEALAARQTTEERMYAAEVYRLKGELLQQSATQQGEAEEHLQQALDVARRQQAKSLELRAAMSLSRLWQQQGKCTEAYELLAPIYGWFTEGFDTVDLQEAKALLEELEG